ncbi:MAG TPA: hypothetical protein VGA79_02625 [Desulfobaccales bacterium]
MVESWKFRLLHQEARSRRLILEGHASPPYERPYHDPLFSYAVVGPDYLSLEVSRDFDGERLLEYLFGLLGEPPAVRKSNISQTYLQSLSKNFLWSGDLEKD